MDKETIPVWESAYTRASKRLEAIEITEPKFIMEEAIAGFVQDMNAAYVRVVMENIEALGLQEKQEEAVKKILKRGLYELMAEYQNSLQLEFKEYLEDCEPKYHEHLPPGIPPKGFTPRVTSK